MRRREVEEKNKKAWDAYAVPWKGWVDNIGLTAEFFRKGGVSFESLDIRPEFQATAANRRKADGFIRRLAGPVRNKKVLVAPCGGGEEALSWANLGARVTGLDQSRERLEQAAAKARGSKISVRYVPGSVLSLPFPGASFDLIYSGHGTVTWIPDLPRWAFGVERVLKPGGKFLLFDFHPLLTAISWRGAKPSVTSAYFDQKPQRIDGPGKGIPQIEINWKFSDILNAFAGEGLRLQSVMELPPGGRRSEYFYKIPHRMILLFSKKA